MATYGNNVMVLKSDLQALDFAKLTTDNVGTFLLLSHSG